MGNGSASIDPGVGSPQSDIFHAYKMARLEFTAMDRAARQEERLAKRQKRTISPDNIQRIAEQRITRIPWKSNGCRYHSFVTYFSNLKRLGWVEESGVEEHSSLQDNYPQGQPRKFYRLTGAGMAASDSEWADPYGALYGR
ncbi:MAG: hypothetical protein MUO89_04885 [Dehalococcoidia bacterium]|nr:hypothetical protein [Dehalococcoidia bacterium]